MPLPRPWQEALLLYDGRPLAPAHRQLCSSRLCGLRAPIASSPAAGSLLRPGGPRGPAHAHTASCAAAALTTLALRPASLVQPRAYGWRLAHAPPVPVTGGRQPNRWRQPQPRKRPRYETDHTGNRPYGCGRIRLHNL
jgi:hypothetical protein